MSIRKIATHRAVAVIVLSITVLICGCRDAATISSSEAKSPDGKWIALAHTDQYGGPGTAGIVSTVQLQSTSGNRDKIEILQLSQNSPSSRLKVNWLTPSKLEITYTDNASIDFQAIKCAGIDISVLRVESDPILH